MPERKHFFSGGLPFDRTICFRELSQLDCGTLLSTQDREETERSIFQCNNTSTSILSPSMTIHCEYLPLCPVIDNATYNTIKEAMITKKPLEMTVMTALMTILFKKRRWWKFSWKTINHQSILSWQQILCKYFVTRREAEDGVIKICFANYLVLFALVHKRWENVNANVLQMLC